VSDTKTGRAPAPSTRYGGRAGRGGSVAVSWGEINGAILQDCITALTGCGDAVLFGRTSDGGAYMVRFLSGGSSDVEYPRDRVECEDVLVEATRIAQER
jgi:hypothetical protein